MYGSNDEAFRVYLCGPFQVERRAGETFVPVPLSEWQGRTGSRTVFKALLGCPGRQARRDVLLALIWPDDDPQQVGPIVQKAVASLRHIFGSCFVEHGTRSNLYRLAPQEQLWVDIDAAQQLLATAETLGRTSPQALALLEEAAGYLNRGPFLEEEEGEWVRSKQETVERLRSRSQRWLAEALLVQGSVGQAETVLTALWERDPFDEEVLRHLLSVLFQQGMKHQALRLYDQATRLFEQEGLALSEETEQFVAQLKRANASSGEQTFLLLRSYWDESSRRADAFSLAMGVLGTQDCAQDALKEDWADDRQSDSHTQDVVEYRRTKQIQRAIGEQISASSFSGEHKGTQQQAPLVCATEAQNSRIFTNTTKFLERGENVLPLHSMVEFPKRESVVFHSDIMQLHHHFSWIKGSGTIRDELQIPLQKLLFNLEVGDQEQDRYSRRQILLRLATLPLITLSSAHLFSPATITEIFLPQCATSLVACHQLMKSQDFLSAEQILTVPKTHDN